MDGGGEGRPAGSQAAAAEASRAACEEMIRLLAERRVRLAWVAALRWRVYALERVAARRRAASSSSSASEAPAPGPSSAV